MFDWLWRRVLDFFELQQEVEEVVVAKEVIDQICNLAQQTHPKEFIAVLRGKPRDGILVVESLIFQPFTNTRRSSHVQLNLPAVSGSVGSVHSHPGPSNRPSRQDLRFFDKRGGVNLIIKYPYRPEDIRAYVAGGQEVPFTLFRQDIPSR